MLMSLGCNLLYL